MKTEDSILYLLFSVDTKSPRQSSRLTQGKYSQLGADKKSPRSSRGQEEVLDTISINTKNQPESTGKYNNVTFYLHLGKNGGSIYVALFNEIWSVPCLYPEF